MIHVLGNIALEASYLIRRLPRVLVASFGILFLIVFLVFFVSLRRAVSSYLETRFFGTLAINEIQIAPSEAVRAPAFGFSRMAPDIGERRVKAVKRIGGISDVRAVYRLNVPAMLRAGLFGQAMRTDIVISGVEGAFFREERLPWREFRNGETVPVVVPRFALDLYNNFAASNGLPALGEKDLIGLPLDLTVGASSFSRSGEGRERKGRIFGFTSKLASTGIVVPAEYLRSVCGGRGGCISVVTLHASVDDPTNLSRVVDEIRRTGLRVESRRDIADKTRSAVRFIDAAFLLILVLVLALTAVAIFNAYLSIVYFRRDEIALKRIVGMSKLRIIATFLAEAAIVGSIYGAAGLYLGGLAVSKLAHSLPAYLPALQGISFGADTGNLLPASMILSVAVSCLSAFIPALFASNVSLSDATKL